MPVAHKVAIVLDPCFGERLVALSQQMHVWVCASPANREVADMIWAKDPEHSLDHGVTTMGMKGLSVEDLFCRMLDAVDEHHGEYSHDPAWSVLHIYGVTITPTIHEALQHYQSEVIEERSDCSVAARS